MKIALDYDDTYNADKTFWDRFIGMAKGSGHEVFIVTMRCREFDWHSDFDKLQEEGVHTIFCDGEPKRQVCQDHGLMIDWWIDDRPEGISNGSSFTGHELDKWREDQRSQGKIEDKAA